jgi:hypothetical protein
MKGKPWDLNEERQLRLLVEEGKSVHEICTALVKTRDSVLSKIYNCGLKINTLKEEEDNRLQQPRVLSSSYNVPKELPSVEDALKSIAAALKALEEPGIDQTEVLRLRNIILGVKVYKQIFADYLNYRELEERLKELEGKYAELDRVKRSQANASS